MRFELCVDSIDGVRAAHAAGADRVELCADLLEGGTTPNLGAIRIARAVEGLRLHVMIRPRGGDFLYDDDEVSAMAADIAAAKAEGAGAPGEYTRTATSARRIRAVMERAVS